LRDRHDTDSQEEDIERILKEAREYYRKKGLISDTEWVAYKKDLESPNYPYAIQSLGAYQTVPKIRKEKSKW